MTVLDLTSSGGAAEGRLGAAHPAKEDVMVIARDLMIGGQGVPARRGRRTGDINPYTGEVYATVAAGGPRTSSTRSMPPRRRSSRGR
jgi:hypothetical protein